MPKPTIANQTILGSGSRLLEGYLWMQDPEGHIYLAKMDDDGLPILT